MGLDMVIGVVGVSAGGLGPGSILLRRFTISAGLWLVFLLNGLFEATSTLIPPPRPDGWRCLELFGSR
jgi:hypothetical protein